MKYFYALICENDVEIYDLWEGNIPLDKGMWENNGYSKKQIQC